MLEGTPLRTAGLRGLGVCEEMSQRHGVFRLAVYVPEDCCGSFAMDTNIRGQIDWEQPFPFEEYAERRLKVKRALEQAGYDGILVTAPRDYHYLTGHDHIWQYRHAVIGFYFDTARGEYVLFDNNSHKVLNYNTPEIKENQ